jgi:4-hydroxybenzoate polyprenyltransferase
MLSIPQHIVVLQKVVVNFWRITSSDFATFVIPNTVFGVACALASDPPLVAVQDSSKQAIFCRIPAVVFFNYSNLLVFNLANQRLWEASQEDKANKPWRPVPSGRMTQTDIRQAMQIIIPAILAANHYLLRAGAETACILTGTWVYNDLKASEDGMLLRNAIVALAFGTYNWTSVKVAIGGGGDSPAAITNAGFSWVLMNAAVIFTTVHMQDLPDVAGDRTRGRRTIPLLLGQLVARWSLAVLIFLWGPVYTMFWGKILTGIPAISLGTYVAWRVLRHRDSPVDDRWTWQLWCTWTAALSLLPLGF